MIIYEDEKTKIEVASKNKVYENSNEFQTIKKYEIAEIFEDNRNTVFTTGDHIRKFLNDKLKFHNTSYYYMEECIITNRYLPYKEKFQNTLRKNSVKVNVRLTCKETGETKTYSEYRYTNKCVEMILSLNYLLDRYHGCDAFYYTHTDLAFCYGGLTDKESSDIKLLVNATKKFSEALVSGEYNKNIVEKVYELADIINIYLERENEPHISGIKPLPQEEVSKIQSYIDYFENTNKLQY